MKVYPSGVLKLGIRKKYKINLVNKLTIPSLPKASPTHFAVMTAIIIGTTCDNAPVNSNTITTSETDNIV